MKVSTEACILGAWVPDLRPTRILDIGTGTGLLSLMLAQRMDAPIDAVELDGHASEQAQQNVSESLWANRIKVINENIFNHAKTIDQTYDLIISNPPFFTNSLKSGIDNKNLAKHDTSDFDKTNLALVLKDLLSEEGRAFILYPELETKQFKLEAEKAGLFCLPALIIRNQPNGPVFRVISRITKYQEAIEADELNIREGRIYSMAFNKLMRTYYLKY
ncbi:MAG: methyltransferase [Reichenbachiella sp.]|uniref:tRNA1(Val) (adenine(37)-N6)-methyltransferase n=1 Tax=Reichenbachiella sp. TaxID=2184521 RepID=UPI0032633534